MCRMFHRNASNTTFNKKAVAEQMHNSHDIKLIVWLQLLEAHMHLLSITECLGLSLLTVMANRIDEAILTIRF